MTMTGQVRWLKAVDGGGARTVLGASSMWKSRMAALGDDIAGTEDAIAVYVKLDPNPHYNPLKLFPGQVGGLIWLRPMKSGETLENQREDLTYDIGWPIAKSDARQGPHLRTLVLSQYGSDGPNVWRSLIGSLTGGKPFRIDTPLYSRIGDALTAYYRHP